MLELIKKKLNKKKFTWLITGSSGFVGSNLVEKLVALNQNVIGIDKKKPLKKYNKIFFTFIKGDLCKKKTFFLIKDDVDYVIHQASLVSVKESFLFPNKYLTENFVMFKNLLDFFKKKKLKSLVFASSCAVYGDSGNTHYENKDENFYFSSKNINSPYAISKQICEHYQKIIKLPFPIAVLRYFNIFGPNQKKNGKDLPIIANWINQLKNEKPLIVYGNGNTTRNFVYIDDVVYANILSALSIKKNVIFNVCSDKSISLNELIKIFKNLFSNFSKVNVIYKHKNIKDIKVSKGSNKKIKDYLNFKFEKSFRDNLLKTFKWQCNL